MANEYTSVFDQQQARDLVVAVNEGNELGDTEFAQDIRTAPYGVLSDKYGPEVAVNRRLYAAERAEASRIENNERSNAQIAGDTAIGVGAGFVNTVGSIVSAGIGGIGAVDKYFDEENDAIANYAVDYAETTQKATQWIRSIQSDELRDRRGLSGVEARLDAEKNLAEYERQTEGREATMVDDLAWVGRGFLNNTERVGGDAALATDVIAEGLGSLGPSAKIANVISKTLTSTSTFQAAKIANAIAPTQGTRFLAMGADAVNRGAIAASVGATEAAGVYSHTVNEVLGLTHGELLDMSPEYSRMVDEGIDPDDAKTTLAANAGIESFKTSFPMAASLVGVVAGKFEAMPLSTFRGSGFIGGLRQVGAQTLEEGGQGFTGQLATNVALRETGVDPERDVLESAPEAMAIGAIAGTGMAGVMGAPSVFRRPDPKSNPESAEQVERRIENAKNNDEYLREQYNVADDIAQTRMAVLEGKQEPMTEQELNEYEFLLDNSNDPDAIGRAYGIINREDQRPAVKPKVQEKSPAGKAASALASAAGSVARGSGSALDTAAKNLENNPQSIAALRGVKAASAKVAEKAAPVVDAVNENVADYNTRPDRKIQAESISSGSRIVELAEKELSTPVATDLSDKDAIKAVAFKTAVRDVARKAASGSVPSTFSGSTPENASTLGRVQGVLTKLAEKGIRINKMSDSDVLYASTEMQNLRNAIPSLPAAMQVEVKKIINSKDFASIQKRVSRIDLNETQNPDTPITDSVVAETKAVAVTNPVNLNSDVVTKILEQDDRTDLTAKDIKFMRVGKRISDAITGRTGAQAELKKEENVALSLKPEYAEGKKKLPLIKAISRNVTIGTGNVKAPSVAEFAGSIMQGLQSETGTVEIDGVATEVGQVVSHYKNFAQHMINKVGALNASHSKQDQNGKGTNEMFESLGQNRKMVKPGKPGNAKSVFYHSSSPGSVSAAREIHADAVATVEVYNAMAEAFPDQFPDGTLSVPELAGFETQTDLSDTSDPQDAVVEDTPTAVEEDVAPATSDETEGSSETSVPTLEEMVADETSNYEDFTKMSEDELIESANRWFVNEEGMSFEKMIPERQKVVTNYTDDILAHFNLDPKMVTGVVWLRTPDKNHLGQAMWGERLIGMRAGAIKTLTGPQNTREFYVAEHTVFHELMHIIDASASADVTRPASHSSNLFSTIQQEEGAVYLEVKAAVAADPEMARYFDYALSYDNDIDQMDTLASELFAEIGALYIEDTTKAKELFPEGVKYVEQIIVQAGGQIPGQATDGDTASESTTEAEPVASDTGVETSGEVTVYQRDFSNVNPTFNNSFLKNDETVSYVDGAGLLSMVREQADTDGYVQFQDENLQALMDTANSRLESIDGIKDKAFERMKSGEDVTRIRAFKNTMMVDKRTGKYDADLLSIASVAVIDWLSGVRASNPKSISEILEDANLTYDNVTDEQIRDMTYGVPVRDVAEGLAKDIVRLWGRRINKDAPMVDARGVAEGMAKELLAALIQMDTGLIVEKKVPYFSQETESIVDQSVFNVFGMVKKQQDIGMKGQEAIKKMLAPELDTMPSIGKPITSIDQTQSRGEVKLTRTEKKTLNRMQTQGHGLAAGLSGVVTMLGKDNLATLLGYQDISLLGDRHPLRASMAGKNLSIERDFQEAMAVVDAINAAEDNPMVYYHVGVSRVGRHQFKGINPQNNKILRALVTPTKSTLDMTTQKHKDAFWLTVAQAADISGFNKVENQDHAYLLANIQEQFYGKYSDAVELIGEYLETGEMDGAALVEAMGGEAEMQQISAVFAVALMEKAVIDGTEALFETTLSFELDGKTDGPGNMMANFGQGVLTEQDYSNFKRVGFFLGSTSMTLNKFFGAGTEKDLYEVTAQKAQAAYYLKAANAKEEDKAIMHAVSRFAGYFGDLKIVDGDYVMTRNTAKNPMTKTVYGSSERGIGQGLAQDMMIEMYKKLIKSPDGFADYTTFKDDFELIFNTKFDEGVDWNKNHLSETDVEFFTATVTQTLGKVLSDTAKEVIGNEITKVNDALVMMTGFQTEFLTRKFQALLDEMIQFRAAEGSIPMVNGKPDRSRLTQRDYDTVVEKIREYSPVYANGMQTLDIGSFSPTDSGIRLSETMDGRFQQPSSMISPETAGVKVIPYITQGRGDAMMMNWIYGGETAPENTLQVFDGIDMPIDKIFEYADQINNAVLKNWESDVMGDIVTDITGFLDKAQTLDGAMYAEAWSETLSNAVEKKSSAAVHSTPGALMNQIVEMRRRNQARKVVFKKIGISVDHMGGSNSAFVQGELGREWTLGEINDLIQAELDNVPVDDTIEGTVTENVDVAQIEQQRMIEDQREPVAGEFSKLVVTDAATVMDGLLRGTRNKPVAAAVRLLAKAGLKTRIIVGSPEEVSKWYKDNIGVMRSGLKQDKKGIYDPINDVILITDNNHETMVHELIHAATFQKLQGFYDGSDTSQSATVTRLETLAEEFMEMDFSNNSEQIQNAANSAKAQILSLQMKSNPFSKAAALNEFMAWSLSNDALMKELKQRPSTAMQRLSQTVKALMQRLLGGIKSDILSGILFNTEILITDEQATPEFTQPDENVDDELSKTAHKFTNFWIDLAKQRLQEAQNALGDSGARIQQIGQYRKNAQDAVDTITFGGFTLSAYQQETFKAIHMVLAMEMRLNSQSAAALNETFQSVTDGLTPAMFGPINAQDRYSAVMEAFGGTENDEGVSDAIAVLLALSQTSKGFRKALDQLPMPESIQNLSTDSLNDFLGSLTGMLMNKAVGTIDTNSQSISETLDQLSESILREDSAKEFRILAGLMNNLNKADAYTSGALKTLAGYTESVNSELRASNRSKLAKISFGAVTAATAFLDQDRAEIQAQGFKRVTHMGTNLDWAIPVREFVNEMIGTDETNRNVVAMLDRTTYAASSVRQNYREDLSVILQKAFDTAPDQEQWRAAHKVLGRTDFAVLFDQNRPNRSFEMIKDENVLDTNIVNAEAAIRSNFSPAVANTILEKGQQLADFMNGKGAGHQLWRNAYAINKMAGAYKAEMIGEIDSLISLYALKGSDPLMRQEITRMYASNPEAMQNLAVYMKGLNKEENQKVASEMAYMNGYKGYIPDAGKPGAKVVIEKDENRQDLEKKGYKRIADAPADSGFSSINRGYYVTSTKQTGTYSQGVMQLIQDTYRGVDSTTGLSVNGMTSGLMAGSVVTSVTNAMNNMTNDLVDNKEALVPVYDEDGVVYYERMMNPDILEKHTAPKSNLAIALGSWAGRQVEEKFAQVYNAKLVDELKRIHDQRDPSDDGLFVNLPEEAKAWAEWEKATPAQRRRLKKPNQVFVESWNVISPQTKQYIEEVFGKDQFFVRKDQMNLALGYRDPSVIDMWTGNTRVPDSLREGVQAITGTIMGKYAMQVMAGIEGTTQGAVSVAKDLIVVRSLVIPYMNTQANVVQLSTRGIPIKQQWQGYKNKLAEIEKFNENRKKIIEFDTRIQLAGMDLNKVRILESQKQVVLDENARMSVAPLIEAGAYKNIAEGITEMDKEFTSGRIGEWIENQTNKLPAGVQTVAKYGLLSKDTTLYKGANKAVQYGDFIAKSIYYDHLMEKGLSHDDAMKLVNEEFVNFSVLPGRTRQYLEGMGATWFLTFKIRIMKIAMNQIRENPARSLILAATIADFGSPQADNLASVIADDRIGYALGWEMMFGSAGLNPWLNLYD
jgi:hypothetical protein